MPIHLATHGAHYKELLETINAHALEFVLPQDSPCLSTINEQAGYFDYVNYNPNSTQAMYGENNLAEFPMFSGGYINFGYWKAINYKNLLLTEEHRIQSSINLYDYIFEQLNLDATSEILEVGSGQGNGCVRLLKNFSPKRVIGLDAVSQQTDRAKIQHANILRCHPNIDFFTGLAEKIPFLENTFSHLISIEAASHFSSMKAFFYEAKRVLRPNGTLLVTTVFPKDPESLEKLKGLLPKYYVYMNDFTIDKVTEYTAYFRDLKITKIGSYIWEGLDEWLKRDELKKSWSRLWLKAYEAGLIDYYVIEAKT